MQIRAEARAACLYGVQCIQYVLIVKVSNILPQRSSSGHAMRLYCTTLRAALIGKPRIGLLVVGVTFLPRNLGHEENRDQTIPLLRALLRISVSVGPKVLSTGQIPECCMTPFVSNHSVIRTVFSCLALGKQRSPSPLLLFLFSFSFYFFLLFC